MNYTCNIADNCVKRKYLTREKRVTETLPVPRTSTYLLACSPVCETFLIFFLPNCVVRCPSQESSLLFCFPNAPVLWRAFRGSPQKKEAMSRGTRAIARKNLRNSPVPLTESGHISVPGRSGTLREPFSGRSVYKPDSPVCRRESRQTYSRDWRSARCRYW